MPNSSTRFLCYADWIDPDTPLSVRTTKPRPVPPEMQVKQKQSSSSTSTSASFAPPSSSSQPTPAPTRSPTRNPTKEPTLLPTTSETSSPNSILPTYRLVFSDEFNIDGRNFQDGSDPKWTALDKNDYTNDALHYYSPDNAFTKNGELVIQTLAETITFVGFNDTSGKNEISQKHFKSAMLQTWNKFCFTGGIVEAEIQLPGKHNVGGLWPAFWLLGNMARHTYVGSTNHVWPWSSNNCTEKAHYAQRINGCMHSQHYGLQKGMGRGAPEIDIFEVQAGPIRRNEGVFLQSPVGQPFMSTSYQVAPGRPSNRPGGGTWPGPGQWYEGLRGGVNTSLNILFYGDYNHFRGDTDDKDYWSDAISYNHQLDERHFQSKFKYRVEWELPEDGDGLNEKSDGYIRWFLNDRFVLEINGTGIVNAGLGSTISTEPMYIIMNTAVSKQWGFPSTCPANCPCKEYDCNSNKFQEICGFSPGFCDMMTNKTAIPSYRVNYVRVYQDPTNPKHKVGCSTPERPTRKYIEAHQELYKTKNDAMPLKPIENGKGTCSYNAVGVSPQSCGGPTRGVCTPSRTCECRAGWTGPHCLSHASFDPVTYEREDGFQDLEFTGPHLKIKGIWMSLGVIGLSLLVLPMMRRSMDGWKPISNIYN